MALRNAGKLSNLYLGKPPLEPKPLQVSAKIFRSGEIGRRSSSTVSGLISFVTLAFGRFCAEHSLRCRIQRYGIDLAGSRYVTSLTLHRFRSASMWRYGFGPIKEFVHAYCGSTKASESRC
jgi:hypothetical protein